MTENQDKPDWMVYSDPHGVDAAAEEEARIEEEKQRQEKKEEQREAKLDRPSIDELPPPGVEEPLTRAHPSSVGTHASRTADAMEKADEERERIMREARGLPPEDES
ncbi:MAG: hypothetical protein WBD86_03620 [Microgenomates group bacterium]